MNPGWKSALIGSVMALGSESAMANKPLPCPKTGPIQDTIGVIQSDTREKIENRLVAIDTQKKHQVVVVTVKNVEEYGYGSIEEMANALGMGCKVGYRWENTGVVVLYTQIPSRYRIETAYLEMRMTDAKSGRILAHSKADGVCKKEDTSCRLDDITAGIDGLIRKEFPDQKSVEPIDNAKRAFDEKKSAESISKWLDSLWIGAVILAVLGTGTWVGVALKRNSRRKALKREILELGVRLQVEKLKYPKWFQDAHIQKIENLARKMCGYSDAALDDLVASKGKSTHNSDMSMIRSALISWDVEYKNIGSKLDSARLGFAKKKMGLVTLRDDLAKKGFTVDPIDMPNITDGVNPMETLSGIERASRITDGSIMALSAIPSYYDSVKGCASDLKKCLENAKSGYSGASARYADIFGKALSVDVPKTEQGVGELAQSFYEAYAQKDIPKIRSLDSDSKTILSSLMWATKEMIQKLQWYDSLPRELSMRKNKLIRRNPSAVYQRDASAYASKTGNREFLEYDMPQVLRGLEEIISTVTRLHSEKKNLSEIPGKLSEFDQEYDRMGLYIGLGGLLARIITQEKEAAEEELRRQKREEEAAEERKQKKEEEAAAIVQNQASNNSTPSWQSEGGQGYSWAGATSD